MSAIISVLSKIEDGYQVINNYKWPVSLYNIELRRLIALFMACLLVGLRHFPSPSEYEILIIIFIRLVKFTRGYVVR